MEFLWGKHISNGMKHTSLYMSGFIPGFRDESHLTRDKLRPARSIDKVFESKDERKALGNIANELTVL